MQGFYGVYYAGAAGRAAFGLLLHAGKAYAVDVAGGDIFGTYAEREDGSVQLSLTFAFRAGTILATGQTLAQPLTATSDVLIASATLAGGAAQLIELPFGQVNVRIQKKVAI